jgi:hypothetical protein
MPSSNRPVAVLVMGILNIVFGAIGCLQNGCCLCSLSLLPKLAAASKDASPQLETVAAAYQDLPVWRASTLGSAALDLALAAMLLIAGIGLIRMRPWGRITSILYGVLKCLGKIFGLGILVFYVEPACQAWQDAYMKQHPHAAQLPGFSGEYISGALAAAYALALLIVMFLPSVKAAFAGRSAAATSVSEDYYDLRREADDGR